MLSETTVVTQQLAAGTVHVRSGGMLRESVTLFIYEVSHPRASIDQRLLTFMISGKG